MPRRGDSVAKATDFFPIPSSLFPKKPSPFHMGWYFGKAPTVNPSVKNQRFLPAPFSKGAFGVHRPKPPLPKGGGLAKPNRGDKRPSGFHMGSYFGKAPTVNPSVTATPCQLPLAREPLGCTGQSPPCQRGVPRHRRGGGIPWPKPRTSSLFPLPYSLNNLPLSTWVGTLGKPPL